LFISPNRQVQGRAERIFDGLQIDASSVSSIEEMSLFLQLATEAGISIDLVVVDNQLDERCLDLARRHRIRVRTLNIQNAETDLAEVVTAGLTDTVDTAVPANGFEDDWQITSVPEAKDNAIDILVAEDNEVNQIVFSQILEGFGYRYAIASDGEEAVKLWQERSPKLILMDVTLPKLTGFEASSRIRGLETVDNSVPIIGVLVQAFDRDRDECFASGMNDVLLKPISPEALEAVINTYIGVASQQSFA
jgi:CheY-like chemotaxis protein